MRETNLPFAARIDNSGGGITQVNGFGPWYGGTYNAGVFSFQKRMSAHFTLGGSYSYVSENDDALNSNLGTSAIGGPIVFVVSLRSLPIRALLTPRQAR